MQWLAGTALTVVLAGSAFLVVTGLAALIRKRWRAGLAALLGVALFVAYCLLLAVAAYALGPAHFDGTKLGPSEKARILAENISELMNISFWGLPLGILVGLVRAIRSFRKNGEAA